MLRFGVDTALKFFGIFDGKYKGGRLERYVEAPITEALVGEVVELCALLEEFKFIKTT